MKKRLLKLAIRLVYKAGYTHGRIQRRRNYKK